MIARRIAILGLCMLIFYTPTMHTKSHEEIQEVVDKGLRDSACLYAAYKMVRSSHIKRYLLVPLGFYMTYGTIKNYQNMSMREFESAYPEISKKIIKISQILFLQVQDTANKLHDEIHNGIESNTKEKSKKSDK